MQTRDRPTGEHRAHIGRVKDAGESVGDRSPAFEQVEHWKQVLGKREEVSLCHVRRSVRSGGLEGGREWPVLAAWSRAQTRTATGLRECAISRGTPSRESRAKATHLGRLLLVPRHPLCKRWQLRWWKLAIEAIRPPLVHVSRQSAAPESSR